MATRNAMATSTPYVGKKKVPILMSLGNIPAIPVQPHVQNQQRRAGRNGTVRDIERGEPVFTLVQLDKVRDLTEQYTIIDVAQRTAEHQRQPQQRPARRAES